MLPGANSCEVICGVNPCKQDTPPTETPPTETCKYKNYKGDGYCDDENNNAGCAWDGKHYDRDHSIRLVGNYGAI